MRLDRWIVSLNEQLRQWREVYQLADNARDVFRMLDERARQRVGELLRQITGRRGRDLDAQFRRQLPRGFWTWEVEGTRLVCLSSLAPKAPFPPTNLATRQTTIKVVAGFLTLTFGSLDDSLPFDQNRPLPHPST